MIPKSGWTSLSKAIVLVSGPDSTKLLNGLVTSRFLPAITKKNEYTVSTSTTAKDSPQLETFNVTSNWGVIHEDIYQEPSDVWMSRNGINSMFLNSKGRVLWDCFIYPTPYTSTVTNTDESQYLIEVDPCFESKLMSYLKIHKLGSKITIKKLDNVISNYYYNDDIENGFDDYLTALDETYGYNYTVSDSWKNAQLMKDKLFNPNVIHNGNLLGFAVDNRIPNFGLKFITTGSKEAAVTADDDSESPSPFIFPANKINQQDITQRRYINGLYECGDNPTVSLFPFEYNLDYINGLSLDKGCYIGQELTIRTYNNQLFRKRIMPGQFFDIINGPPSQLSPSHVSLTVADDSLLPMNDIELETQAAAVEAEEAIGFQPSTNPFGGISKVVRKRKASPGKILSSRDNLAFALVSIGAIENSKGIFQVKTDQGPKGFKVFTPDWWPQ